MVEVPHNLQFDAPEELTHTQRARDALITALLWAVYLYLWVPLVTLLAWALGFEFAYEVMVRAGGAEDLLPILLQYTVVISLIFSGFTIWSVSNRLRFRGLKRRSARQPVDDTALAEYYKVPVAQVQSMRTHQIMHVDIDELGRPEVLSVERARADYDEPNSMLERDQRSAGTSSPR